MNCSHRLLPGMVLLAACTAFQALPARAWNDHVLSACTLGPKGGEADIALCHAYIEGFLDGAILTDTAIVDDMEGESSTESDYLRRAYMTRLGYGRGRLPATALAHFCLPEERPRGEVVAEIADTLDIPHAGEGGVAEAVYDIIKSKFPCED